MQIFEEIFIRHSLFLIPIPPPIFVCLLTNPQHCDWCVQWRSCSFSTQYFVREFPMVTMTVDCNTDEKWKMYSDTYRSLESLKVSYLRSFSGLHCFFHTPSLPPSVATVNNTGVTRTLRKPQVDHSNGTADTAKALADPDSKASNDTAVSHFQRESVAIVT